MYRDFMMENEFFLDELETQKIMNFIAHCNQFLDGKYLFATSKLKEINEDICTSKGLSLLKDECLDGFNASLFKTKCLVKLPTKNGTFTSPTEKEDFIAIAFTFVDDICNEVVDYDNFTVKYFSSEKNENKFAKQVIEPLKLIVSKLFNLPEDNETEYNIEAVVKKNETPMATAEKINNSNAIAVVENLLKIIGMKQKLDQDQTNAFIILRELKNALENNQVSEIQVLCIAIGYIKKFLSGLDYMVEELEFCLRKN